MTTPSKSEIYEKALELWRSDQIRNGCMELAETIPEYDELLESGYIFTAQHTLMSESYEYKAYLLEELGENFCDIVEKQSIPNIGEHMTKHVKNLTWFDLEEQEKSNTLISGTNSTGKTRLACYLASVVRFCGWNCVAFDNSGIWKKVSDIPNYFQVHEGKIRVPISRNMIYDTALLKVSDQRKFVNEILQYFWVATLNNPVKTWQAFIFEEFELYGRFVRGDISENIYRIMHVGRNQKIRVIGITTDLALIDPCFIRLCMQRYHFKLSVEENSLRKFRRYYGKDWARVCTELGTGYCMYWNNGRAKVVKIPLFEKNIEEVITK